MLLLLLIVRNYYTVLRECCCDVLSMLQNGTLLLSHIYGNLQQNDNTTASLCAIYATLALLCIEFDIDIVIPGHVQLLSAVQVRYVISCHYNANSSIADSPVSVLHLVFIGQQSAFWSQL